MEAVVKLAVYFLRKNRGIFGDFSFFGGVNLICPYEGICKLVSQMDNRTFCITVLKPLGPSITV